jgi:nitrate reductase assembly molybdenum cofactor insertion protein NarJ
MATENPLPTDSKYDQYDFPTTAPESQSGHPGHTTPEQDAKVHQLRAELEKLGYTERLDTLTLLRFLRARKFDVEAAKTMYVDQFLRGDFFCFYPTTWKSFCSRFYL